MLPRVWTRFALVAAVCAAAGCSPSPAAPTPPPTDEPTLGTLALPVPPPLTLPAVLRLRFRPCSGAVGLQCATMTVPLDYADPSGTTISIAVARLPAVNAASGSIVVNPGGPGESGIDYLNEAASRFSRLRASYNIVSFDPRGTGRSEPAHCLPGADLDEYYSADPIGNTAQSEATLVALSQRFAAGCLARTGRTLLFLGTQYTARDLEELRRALGGAPLTYLGLSYGTFLGETYASLYPDKVRAMVLDGVENPTIPLLPASDDQATAFEHDLTDFEAGCAQGCGFSRPPAATIAGVLAQADRAPLIVNGRPLTRAEAITGILTYLYEPAEDRNLEQALANAINQAASGNGDLLLGSADDYVGRHSDGTYAPLAEANIAIACADNSVPTTLSTYVSEGQRMNAIDPHFGAAMVWGDLACAYWPFHAPPAPFRTVETAPLLFVGATGDPATPYRWALGAIPFFPGSVLLTRDGDGHVSFGKSTCADSYEQTYLVRLTLPPSGTTCPTN
ncbi:MAG TPA: alpha/beta hydrolase [Candidatus Saccharimonadales bacterium]|nr:alpha/beta hydrolase [Candidatus Saccharimonadales bacterium]